MKTENICRYCGAARVVRWRAIDYDTRRPKHYVRTAQWKYECRSCKETWFDQATPAVKPSHPKCVNLQKKKQKRSLLS